MDEIAIKIEHVSKEYRLGARSVPMQQRTWVRNFLHWTMYPSR